MITIRPASARGKAHLGWLDSQHTFSFGNYYDPNHMGFSHLRVINEDQVQPSRGFGTHSHSNMEIISYVLAGALEHQDSIGNGSVIRPGDVQRMSAGSGIAHSEFNASTTEPVHFLQIWITPNQTDLEPSYEQQHFPLEEKQGQFQLVASPDGRDNSVTIHQDTQLYLGVFAQGDRITQDIDPNRSFWLQMARGSAKLKGQLLQTGDGVGITQETRLELVATEDNTEILLFDLA